MKKSDYPEDQLLQALYWIWDAFDRSSMRMFLVYETAAEVIQDKRLAGDKITVGVRDLDWNSGSTSILKAFTGEPIEKTTKYEVFKNPFNKVPVYIYIFENHPCIQSPNQVLYGNEYFMLPNPYKEFIDRFGARP